MLNPSSIGHRTSEKNKFDFIDCRGNGCTKIQIMQYSQCIVTRLLAAYHVFNMPCPKGPTGHSKNIYMFLEHVLLGNNCHTLPIGVKNFLSQI
jgi:hypothetical protein